MRQFLPYIHFLRGVAILYVVSVHARGFASYWHSSPEVYDFLDSFSDPSEGNGTTMFLFIGGFLFQHLNKTHFNFRKYITQKFKVLILPYLVISLPLIIYRFSNNFQSLYLPDDFQDRSMIHQIAHFLFTGTHLPPFWFISTIILFYISSPVLHALDNPKFYKFVLPVILVAAMFTFRPEHNANPFLSYLHFIPVYLTGMCASYYKEKILTDNPAPFFLLLLAYLSMSVGELTGLIDQRRDISFDEVLAKGSLIFNVYFLKTIILCFMWLALFYLLRHKRMPLLDRLAHYSFGIFFVHYFFISITRKIVELNNMVFDFTLITYLLYFTVILGISVATVHVIKIWTGPYSRNLIGS